MHRSYACSSAARLSARRCPVVGLPLICHACIARLSTRLSAGLPLSCRWYIAALSAGVVVAALSAALPLVLPLLCLFVRRWSHWSVTGLSVRQSLLCHLSVAVPSPRAVVADLSARLLLVAALPLVCRSAAPLGCSTA